MTAHPPTNSTEALDLAERLMARADFVENNTLTTDTSHPLYRAAASHLRELQEENARLGRVNAETPAPFGYVYHNPDVGTEFAPNHPIQSGEVHDASDVRPATEFEAWLVGELQAAEALASTYREENERLREIADLARELISPRGMVNRGVDRGLVVVEKADRSDPHYRLCTALEALTTPRTETDK